MQRKEKPIESKTEYYFGDNQVLERAKEEDEFEGSRVEDQDVAQLVQVQEKLSDLPSFWKDQLTKLALYSKSPNVTQCITEGNVRGLEFSYFDLEERIFEAHPCQITLLQEIYIDSYFYATKIFKLTGVPNLSTIPDLTSAVFCSLVHSTILPTMAPYQSHMVFVREDEVDPLEESDCPDWRSFWTEALCNKFNRACIEHLCQWPGKPQRVVTFNDGSTIIVQKEPNEFYLIKQCLVCARLWKYGNYNTPYNPQL